MKRKITFVVLLILAAVVLIPAMVGASSALANGGYEINWWTIDGGGGTSESVGDQYALTGTIGQHDASDTIEGGTYSLRGGFWAGIQEWFRQFFIHLPVVMR